MKRFTLSLLFASISWSLIGQTILVEKNIYNSTKPIILHSISKDLKEVYFSSPLSETLKFYKIDEDKVVDDLTVKAKKFKGFVRFNEVYSMVQYENRLDVINSLNSRDRFTIIHPEDGYDISSITYDNQENTYLTLSGTKILRMEISPYGIASVDTLDAKLRVNGTAKRISSYNGKPFLAVEQGLDLSYVYMLDSTKSTKLRYPINYTARNIAIEFLNQDTLFVSRTLRPGESELVMIYASQITRHPDSLYLDKINQRAQEQIDSIKAEALVNALEFTDTVSRDIGQGRFTTLLQRTNDAIVAMTTLNQALQANPRSFISKKDSIYFVLGPKQNIPNSAKIDSARFYAKAGLLGTTIDLGEDSLIVPDDVVIRLKCLDKATGVPVGYSVDYYEYETNSIIKSARIQKGEICYFSYIPNFKLGLTITSEGYLPHSIKFDDQKYVVRKKQIEKLVLLQPMNEEGENRFALNNIYFDFAKWNLTPVAKRELDIVFENLKNANSVTIEGHTDWIGSNAYNLKLSKKRANAARDYLVKKGMKKSQIKTIGKGETQPRENNKTDKGRAANRRCEFIID